MHAVSLEISCPIFVDGIDQAEMRLATYARYMQSITAEGASVALVHPCGTICGGADFGSAGCGSCATRERRDSPQYNLQRMLLQEAGVLDRNFNILRAERSTASCGK